MGASASCSRRMKRDERLAGNQLWRVVGGYYDPNRSVSGATNLDNSSGL
jgi:hypothetical protein